MQFFKKMIFSVLLLSFAQSHCADPLGIMAFCTAANLAIQSLKDAVGYLCPGEEQKMNGAVVHEKAKYAADEQKLHAITVEENLEYARAKQALKQCLRAKKGTIDFDDSDLPEGCEACARAFIECGGEREMIMMINNINRARNQNSNRLRSE